MKYLVSIFLILCTITVTGQNVNKIKVSTLNGVEKTLDEVISADKNTLLSIGGTWCRPCIMQKPFVASLEKQYPQYLKVVFVFARDTSKKVINKFGVDETSNTYFLIDQKATDQLKVNKYPTNILVNSKGRIIEHNVSLNDVGNYIQ